MELHNLPKIRGNKKGAKRIGRGTGSGKGDHTVGRGMKGQKSRSGYRVPFGFEGGQIPLFRKLPMIGGFKNPTKKQIVHISLNDLNVFKSGEKVTPDMLSKKGRFKKLPKHGVKILATGEITKKLSLSGFLMSKAAKDKLEKAGCTIK